MLIYTPIITSRFTYISKILFGDILQVEFSITDSISHFREYQGIKWAYSQEESVEGLNFYAHSLLFENKVVPQELTHVPWKNLSLFFPVKQNPFFPFDPFALSFYLISRYEEYLPNAKRDAHDRFEIESSIAYQRGFHRIPLVNMLAVELAFVIRDYFPDFTWNTPSFHQVYTCDVDIAYRYKGKGFFRWGGGVIKSMLQGKWKEVGNYFSAAINPNFQDPYDLFQERTTHYLSQKQSVIHFIPIGDYGTFDKQVNPNSKCFKNLIDYLKKYSDIGLHPSYSSHLNYEFLEKEKKKLEKLLEKPIVKSRQHYLRLKFPNTYQFLLESGIEEDYSLGWSNEVGFRASVSVPFYFYDLTREKETKLKIHSLHVMDVALMRISKSQQEYDDIFEQIKNEVQKWGGEFVFLEHNSSQIRIS